MPNEPGPIFTVSPSTLRAPMENTGSVPANSLSLIVNEHAEGLTMHTWLPLLYTKSSDSPARITAKSPSASKSLLDDLNSIIMRTVLRSEAVSFS